MTANSKNAAALLNTTSGDHDTCQPVGVGQVKGPEAAPNDQTNKSESDKPTMKLRSGRVVQKKWFDAQAKLRKDKNNVGDKIRLQPPSPLPDAPSDPTSDVPEVSTTSPPPGAPPKPISDVFNIPKSSSGYF